MNNIHASLILAITQEDTYFLIGTALLVFILLVLYFIMAWRHHKHDVCLSPYSEKPLRRASDINWMAKEKVLRYMYDRIDYANRIFDFKNAALCRETGRIFPNCINWWGTIHVDWKFLNKHFPGNYISWGSLNRDQQEAIKVQHASIDEYQTHYSSRNPAPKNVEKEYALMKPGPLYADPETGILIGWKCVPDTDLEVLIVQRPIERYLPGLHKKY